MGIAVVSAVVMSFIASMLLTPLVASAAKRRGIMGIDIHKPHRPAVPETCGLAVASAVILSIIILVSLFYGSYVREFAALIGVGLVACIIGLVDDLKPLNPRVKPLLTALGGIPILALGVYSPRPMIPLVGASRLTLVYPVLVLVGIAVTANAVNMIDVFNGVMPGSCGVVAASTVIVSMFLGRMVEASVAAALMGALAAFYFYNRYPAKVFAGDSGSLFVGATLGALAIIGRLEIFMIVALMPHIMNAFYSLSSIGRLYERREVASRPVRILEDGRLDSSLNGRAPLTLARLILVHGPLDEKSVAKIVIILTAVSSCLAVATMIVVPGMR